MSVGREENASTRKIRGVIFDMDGTMFNTEPLSKACWQRAAEEMGLSLSDQVVWSFTGKNLATVRQICQEALGGQLDFDRLWALKEEKYFQEIARGVPEKPGLNRLLSYMKEQGLPGAVATSSSEERVRLTLETAGLEDRFAAVICGDDIPASKPAPDIFLAAAKALGLDPKNCLVLEDSGPGLMAGVAAGCFVIYIPDVVQVPEEAKKGISARLDDLAQAADWIRMQNQEEIAKKQQENEEHV